MCTDCGCEGDARTTGLNLGTGKAIFFEDPHEHVHADGTRHSHPPHAHMHSHGAPPVHRHAHGHADDDARASAHEHHHDSQGSGVKVEIETRILAKNDALAARNRAWLADRGILALNLMGAPGAGKTALLERTIRDMKDAAAMFVLEGDQATANDGERIRAAGAAVVQINTGTGCHLDADMVARALEDLNPGTGALVVVENVGNLVCPALFDLGEGRRVLVFSVTEGEDKPLKYPHMFHAADLVLLNKVDLLPHLEFDVARAAANVRTVNPDTELLTVSARSGEGMAAWYAWLKRETPPRAR